MKNLKEKTERGESGYLNKNCWLVKNLNYAPYRRCKYCDYKFRNCLFLQYQIISLVLIIFFLALFFLIEGKVSTLVIVSVFVFVIVYGYFFNRSTEKIIKANFSQKIAKDALKELTDKLEQKVREQTWDIQKKADHLEKLLKMRSEFLDIASHQLRTPTSVIKGIMSMMVEGDLERMPKEKQKEFIQSAFEKSLKLEQITHDLLTASEFDSNKYKINNKTSKIQLEDVIDRVIKSSQFAATQREIKIFWQKPKQPLPLIVGESRYLEEVFSNLIDNALKYTPSTKKVNEARAIRNTSGRVELFAELVNQNIIIKIKDNGIGIAKEEIGKLFQKFTRAINATEMYTDGSGLGLFIVKEIVEGHHGKVWVESEINKGTTFFISLPVAGNAK